MRIVHYVNNTSADLRGLEPALAQACKTGSFLEELADVFSIEILRGYNSDGSDRVIIGWKVKP